MNMSIRGKKYDLFQLIIGQAALMYNWVHPLNTFLSARSGRIFICFLVSACSLKLYAQDYAPGEYLVQWQSVSHADDFRDRNIQERSRSMITLRRVMNEPFVVDLLVVPLPELQEKVLNQLRSEKGIVSVSQNALIERRRTPDDPDFSKQWQFVNTGNSGGVPDADIDADDAWDITTGGLTYYGDTIVVCVIDEGINATHPDLQCNMWKNHDEIPGNGIDDDNNGYTDDYHGWNVELENDDLSGGGGHGTPVAGIVGACGNNGTGVAGVNWNVKIMFVDYYRSTEANALAAYAYAYKMRKMYNESQGAAGAFVVVTNASWGTNYGKPEDAPLWCALYDALGEAGILNVAATANLDVDVDQFGDLPTSCPSPYLVSVTNMNRTDIKVTNAGYGRKSIDVGGYGQQVFTISRTGYSLFGGTSAAAPLVAGVAALIGSAPCPAMMADRFANPAGAALQLKDVLLYGTTPNLSLENRTTTAARVNARQALEKTAQLCSSCAPPIGVTLTPAYQYVRIEWQNQTGTAAIHVRFRSDEESAWTTYYQIDYGFLVEGLAFCTEYEFQIGWNCGQDSITFSYSHFVTSFGCCGIPEKVVFAESDTAVVVKWAAPPGFSSFDIFYSAFGEGSKIDSAVVDSFLIVGKALCQQLTISLRSKCNDFGTVSEKTKEYIFTTSCGNCTDAPTCGPGAITSDQEWIDQVITSGINNKSGMDANGYGDYRGTQTGQFVRGKMYELNIVPGFSSGAFAEHYLAYADWNQNGEFETPEKIFDIKSSADGVQKGQFIVPPDATIGLSRLRILMGFQQLNGPCSDPQFEFGEVEDYCIEIFSENCGSPDSIRVDSTGRKSVAIVFGHADDVDKIDLLIRKSGSVLWDTITMVQSPVLVDSLENCAEYDIQFLSHCAGLTPLQSKISTFKAPCNTSTFTIFSESCKIGPIPFDNTLSLKCGNNALVGGIRIVDIFGNIRYALSDVGGATEIIIEDLGFLPPGVYFLETISENNSSGVYKVIKF